MGEGEGYVGTCKRENRNLDLIKSFLQTVLLVFTDNGTSICTHAVMLHG